VAGLIVVILASVACNPPWAPSGPDGLTCIAVADDLCVPYAQGLGLGTDPTVVAVQLECTKPPCTTEQGEVRVLVRRADGRVEESGFGWQAGVAPAIPAQPTPAPAAPTS
jgi:hypothetical protein